MVFCDFFGVAEDFLRIPDGFFGEGRWRAEGVAQRFRQRQPRAGQKLPDRGSMMVRRRVLAIRQAGNVLLGGASGAGSLLLNTKASQEAACSRAPAAIVPVRA